jgi:hypothetical protein
MKLTRYIALAALLVAMVLGVLAAAGPPYAEADSMTAENAVPSAFDQRSEKQAPTTTVVVDACDFEFQIVKAGVKERVGVPPLDIYRAGFRAIKTNDGYGAVQLKPKINATTLANNGFSGLGHDHFARADV